LYNFYLLYEIVVTSIYICTVTTSSRLYSMLL